MSKRASTAPNDPDVLTAERVAGMIGVSVDRARAMMADGTIKGQKPGKRWLTSKAAVLNYLGGLK